MVSLLIRLFVGENTDAASKRNIYGYICGGVGIFFNLILFAAKLFIGTVSGSISITADAFNNLTDAGSSAVTLGGFVWSGRKADSKHPFGHGRIEYLTGILISIAIILVGAELLKSSVEKIINPGEFVFNMYLVLVLALSIAVKLYMAFYNKSCGKMINSATLCAVAADSLSDCIATGAVLISSVIMYYTNLPIDGYVGAIVSILIIRTGITAVSETAGPLLGSAPDEEFVKNIEKIVYENPETIGIHDLVVHDYGPNKVFVSLHMEVDGSKDMYVLHDAVDVTEQEIYIRLGCETVIHMDPIDVNNPEIKEIYSAVKQCAANYNSGINIHDLRMVPGPTHTNVIFDAVLTPELMDKKDEIKSVLENAVKELNEKYFAVIKIETSYC